MKLSSMIASVGQNVNFISFVAHAGFSFMLIAFFPYLWVLVGLVLGAAAKEFWFDIKYETNQTWEDGLLDFSGYMAGIGLLLARVYL